jgi:hypothetical protein
MWTAPHARKAGGSHAEAQVRGKCAPQTSAPAGIANPWRLGGMELANPTAQASGGFGCAPIVERGCEA